jgi:ketosteroid isomerase-like protein
MSNPIGGIRRGWAEISGVYERIFNGPASVYVEFHDYSVHAAGALFVAVGRERGRLEMYGETLQLAIRTTRIFTRGRQRWRQIHHHGSMDEPESLRNYQSLVLGD